MQPLQRANIRLAATVLLLRETGSAMEVFMMQRPGGVDFPDLHVFPGGKLDDQDLLEAYLHGCDDATANRQLGVDGGGLRYWVAAIRECFEECGVLLARRDGKFVELSDPDEIERFEDYRHRLIEGSMSMGELCVKENLVLAGDCMSYFSHWITPDSVPRRFDTRFFIARMPSNQTTAAHHWETAGSEWVEPSGALKAGEEGRWQMISPTVITLTSVAGYANVDALFNAVRNQTHLPDLTAELRRQGMHPLR